MTTTPHTDPYTAANHLDPPTVAVPVQRQAPTAPPVGTPRTVRRWPWAVGGVVLGMVLGAGFGGGGASTTAPAVAAAPSTVTLPAPPPETVVVEVPVAAAPVAAAPATTGPLTSFDDGVYEVGIDIEAGKYKTPGPGSTDIMDSCYMEVSDGTGDIGGIEQNDNLTGPGVVTVAEGEYFTVSGGCTWTKEG